MKQFLRDVAVLATAWFLMCIPVWLAFQLYFTDVYEDIYLLRTESFQLSVELSEGRKEAQSLRQSLSVIRNSYETDIPELSEKMDKMIDVFMSNMRSKD